jgi:hypothetical protein
MPTPGSEPSLQARKKGAASKKALLLVRGGLVLDLLYHRPKVFQRGGVLGAELLRRATQIGVLDGVEHLACERQWSAAMILLADEVEFRARRLMALEAIEPQEVVDLLRLRNEGGSVGTSLAQTMQERRDQFHTLRLGESLDSFNANVVSFLDQARGVFLQQTGDPSAAQQLAWQAIENLRQQQASSLAYFDVFLLLAAVTLALVPVLLLMKRSVAEKGAHIGHE